MAKKQIFVTEKQLKHIQKQLLQEISVADKYKIESANGKTELNFQEYSKICSLDPTSKIANNQLQAGKYCNWLLQHVNALDLNNDEYVSRLRIALEQYNDGIKRGILKRNGVSNDIGSFKTVDNFVTTIRDLMGSGKQLSQSVTNHMETLKGQYELVAESPNWYIIKPLTFEAERYFGGGTDWCTVANESYFDAYMKEDSLYITIPKSDNNKLKMQFHFKSLSFASYDDEVYQNPKWCIATVVGETESYNEICDMWEKVPSKSNEFNDFKYTRFSDVQKLLDNGESPVKIFDSYDYLKENLWVVGLNNSFNVVIRDNNKYRLLSPNMWFDYEPCLFDGNNNIFMVTDDAYEKYQSLLLDYGGNIKQTNGIISELPQDGWAPINFGFDINQGNMNYINSKGELLLSNNVACTYTFHRGYGKIYEARKGFTLINTRGEKVFNDYFRQIYLDASIITSVNAFFQVIDNNDSYNIVNQNGEILFNENKILSVHNVNNKSFGFDIKNKVIFGLYIVFSIEDGRGHRIGKETMLGLDGVLYKFDSTLTYNSNDDFTPLTQQEIDELGLGYTQPTINNETGEAINESKNKKHVYLTENQVEEIQQKLQQARKETNTNPTEGQKEAGNYKMGRVHILGYDIAIENPKGSIRRGKDKDGNEWQILMKNDYGYFTHTLAYDGDAVDVFLGNHFDTYSIFAIDQKLNGKFDETKIMLGFKNEKEAKEAYLSNYCKGWKGFWKITEVPHTVFQKWLYDGYQQRKPFFEYVEIKKAKLNESAIKLLNESTLDDYFDEINTYTILNNFVDDMENNKTTQNWRPLINPSMYQKALQTFSKQGNLNGFPEKYVYQWIGIIMRNTIQLDVNTELAGHSSVCGYDDIDNSYLNGYIYNTLGFTVMNWGDPTTLEITPEFLINQLKKERLTPAEQDYVDSFIANWKKINEDAVHRSGENKGQTAMFMSQPELDYYDNEKIIRTKVNNLQGLVDIYNSHNTEQENRVTYETSDNVITVTKSGQLLLKISPYILLDMVGLYDWMQMPDGSDAWSDFGLRPLYEILNEYDDEKTTPEECLVIINKALDVTHQRGDMASIFIEGGSETLTQISNYGYVNEKLDLEQNEKNDIIKLYHSTTYANLASILNSGIMRIDMPHKEGHGDMLWFSTKPNDYGNEIEISIKVPQSEFGNDYTSFEFVNKNHVVISRNLSLANYRPSIELFSLSMPGYIVYFKKDRIQRYIDGMPNGALEEEVFEACDKLREENSDFNTILDFVENNPTLLS